MNQRHHSESRSVSDVMEEDHRRLDGIFNQMVSLVESGDPSGGDREFQRFRSSLENHIHVEEDLLFPPLTERVPGAIGPVRVMRTEHLQILGII